MNILHLIYNFHVGGTQTFLVDLANIQAADNTVSIVCINKEVDTKLKSSLNKNIKFIELNREQGSKSIKKIIALWALIKKIKPDIIHCHNENIVPIIYPFKNKTILTIHTTAYKNKWIKNYAKIISISKSVQKKLETQDNIISSLIYNGIDSSKIKVAHLQASKKTLKIVQVGRLESKIKGQDILIKAVKKIVENNPDLLISVDFIGDGSSKNELINMVKKLNLNEQIKFVGEKSRNYVFENLKNYDLYIHPARYEGFGLTIAEAMAAKIPVIVSDIEGPLEIIPNENYGLKFKSEDAICLAKKIMEHYHANQSEVDLRVNNAFNRVLKDFDINVTAKKYIHEYKK